MTAARVTDAELERFLAPPTPRCARCYSSPVLGLRRLLSGKCTTGAADPNNLVTQAGTYPPRGRRCGARPSIALHQEPTALAVISKSGSAPMCGEDEHPTGGSGPLSREERLQAFLAVHAGSTLADIKYSARVYTPDFQDWRCGHLKEQSVMSGRIENILSGAGQLMKKPRNRRPN
jgi:hypothetical protein